MVSRKANVSEYGPCIYDCGAGLLAKPIRKEDTEKKERKKFTTSWPSCLFQLLTFSHFSIFKSTVKMANQNKAQCSSIQYITLMLHIMQKWKFYQIRPVKNTSYSMTLIILYFLSFRFVSDRTGERQNTCRDNCNARCLLNNLATNSNVGVSQKLQHKLWGVWNKFNWVLVFINLLLITRSCTSQFHSVMAVVNMSLKTKNF